MGIRGEEMMADKDTIIVVGVTRVDSYNNLWVTPAGGGDEVKIGEKRAGLHPLFQQGKAVMLHWETYKNKAYVADAKAVEGELPDPTKPDSPPLQIGEDPPKKAPPAPQELGMWWKEMGCRIGDGSLEKDYPNKAVGIKHAYYKRMSEVTGVNFK